jgi:hypothetical protein
VNAYEVPTGTGVVVAIPVLEQIGLRIVVLAWEAQRCPERLGCGFVAAILITLNNQSLGWRRAGAGTTVHELDGGSAVRGSHPLRPHLSGTSRSEWSTQGPSFNSIDQPSRSSTLRVEEVEENALTQRQPSVGRDRLAHFGN